MMRRLLFTDPSNLDFRGGENTFRVGTKWADLEIGEVVQAVFLNEAGVEEDLHMLMVCGLVIGDFSDMLHRHAINNHRIYRHEECRYVAADFLQDILKDIYPGAEDSTRTVVIYLEPPL